MIENRNVINISK